VSVLVLNLRYAPLATHRVHCQSLSRPPSSPSPRWSTWRCGGCVLTALASVPGENDAKVARVSVTYRTSGFLRACHATMIICRRPGLAAKQGVGMDDTLATLGVQLAVEPDDDAEEIADATVQLRRDLLDVEAVEVPPAGEPPSRARAVELAALGALAVTVAKSQLLGAVVAAVRSWLAGQPQRSIKPERDGDVLELTGLSSKAQQRLADGWLRRHTGP
jgi:hypothetical protein